MNRRLISGLLVSAALTCAGAARSQNTAIVASTEIFPSYFVGTFSDLVPKLVGGSVPDTKFALTCEKSGACIVKIGQDVAGDFKRFSTLRNLERAQGALSYAKGRKDVPASSHVAWQAKNLMPLLASDATIESCIDLKDPSLPDGYMLACKLDRDPWARNTVLLMGAQLSNCGILFCGYELFPLFREQP